MHKKEVEVHILQQSYRLTYNAEKENKMRQAAQSVHQMMTDIHSAGKIRIRERIAVLAAINLSYDLIEAQEQLALALQEVQSLRDAVVLQHSDLPAQQIEDHAQQVADIEAIINKIDLALDPVTLLSSSAVEAAPELFTSEDASKP